MLVIVNPLELSTIQTAHCGTRTIGSPPPIYIIQREMEVGDLGALTQGAQPFHYLW